MTKWSERIQEAIMAERLRAEAMMDEIRRTAKLERERAVSAGAMEAAVEAGRKARAEADAELVKLRRAVDTTALWYEDLLEATRVERDRCTGKLSTYYKNNTFSQTSIFFIF